MYELFNFSSIIGSTLLLFQLFAAVYIFNNRHAKTLSSEFSPTCQQKAAKHFLMYEFEHP